MGPEAGVDGGLIVACGPPAQIALAKRSHTGAVLAGFMRQRSAA